MNPFFQLDGEITGKGQHHFYSIPVLVAPSCWLLSLRLSMSGWQRLSSCVKRQVSGSKS